MAEDLIGILQARLAQIEESATVSATISKSLARIAELPEDEKQTAIKKVLDLKERTLAMIDKQTVEKIKSLGGGLEEGSEVEQKAVVKREMSSEDAEEGGEAKADAVAPNEVPKIASSATISSLASIGTQTLSRVRVPAIDVLQNLTPAGYRYKGDSNNTRAYSKRCRGARQSPRNKYRENNIRDRSSRAKVSSVNCI